MKHAARLLALFLFLLAGAATAQVIPVGEKRIAVLVIQFSNQGSVTVPRDAIMRELLTGDASTDKIWRASSGGKLGIKSVNILGPIKISLPTTDTCRPATWMAEAARVAGVSYRDYDFVTGYSLRGRCTYSGLATPVGNWSWVPDVAAGSWTHEMGHNLGLEHARDSTGGTYGDKSDPMSGQNNALYAAPTRAKLGWLTTGQYKSVMNGRYTLGALDSFSSRLQVLKIANAGPDKGFYYVSLRQAVGFDSRLLPSLLDTVSVHRVSATGDSRLMTTLAPGASYYNRADNFRATALAVREGAADVQVYSTGQACTPNTPTVQISPATLTVKAGDPISIEARILNRNPVECVPATFNVQGTVASVSSSESSAIIASGETATVAAAATLDATGKVCVKSWISGYHPGTGCATVTVRAAGPAPVPDDPPPEPTPEPIPEPTPEPEPPPAPKDEPAPEPPPVTKPEPPPVQAGSATIIASADTYLSSPHKTIAWGTKTDIMDGSGYAPLVRFAVFASQGGPVPDGATITAAKVRLYKTTAYNATWGLYRIGSDWSESVTYAQSPGWAETPDATASLGWEPGWIEFGLTGDQVREAVHGWRMGWISGYSNALARKWASREHADPALRPQLVVEWQ